jgi:hypothetical protein
LSAEAARRWRDTWEPAWLAKDADAIDALYAEGAVYRSHPLREPEESARAYVERQFAEEQEVECRFGEPLVTGDRAAVEWWATFREAGAQVTLAGVTVLRFDDEGLVSEHMDYWVESAGRHELSAAWGR